MLEPGVAEHDGGAGRMSVDRERVEDDLDDLAESSDRPGSASSG